MPLRELDQQMNERALDGVEPTTSLGLADIVSAVSRRKGLLAVIVAVSIGIALAVAFLTRPVFRAETTVIPSSSEQQGLGQLLSQYGRLAETFGVGSTQSQTQQERVALLESRALKERMVVKHNLAPLLFPDRWDAARGTWKDDGTSRPPSVWMATQLFANKVVSITSERLKGTITVAIEWDDPKLAATWANQLVMEANSLARERAIAEAEQSMVFLQKELANTDMVGIQQSIYRLIEGQISQRMLASVRSDFAFHVVDAAVPPELRSRPRRLYILLAGGFAGCAIGVAVCVFVEAWRRNQRQSHPRLRAQG